MTLTSNGKKKENEAYKKIGNIYWANKSMILKNKER